MRLPEIQLHMPNPDAQFLHITLKSVPNAALRFRKNVVGHASFSAGAARTLDNSRVDVPVDLVNFVGTFSGRMVLRLRLQVCAHAAVLLTQPALNDFCVMDILHLTTSSAGEGRALEALAPNLPILALAFLFLQPQSGFCRVWNLLISERPVVGMQPL